MDYLFAARISAALHLVFAGFIFLGWLALMAGALAGASYARNRLFRITHLAGFLGVMGFAMAGFPCPLTWLEYRLRTAAGYAPPVEEPFLSRVVSAALYPDVSPSLLFWSTLIVGLSTVVMWWAYPPRSRVDRL